MNFTSSNPSTRGRGVLRRPRPEKHPPGRSSETPTFLMPQGARRSLFGQTPPPRRSSASFYGQGSTSWQPGQMITPHNDITTFANDLATDLYDEEYDEFGDRSYEEGDCVSGQRHHNVSSQSMSTSLPTGIWTDLKTLISTEIGKVNENITSLNQRIGKIENTVQTLETKVDEINSDGSISSSSGAGSSSNADCPRKRRRLTPLSLQVNNTLVVLNWAEQNFLNFRIKLELFINHLTKTNKLI